MGQRQSEIIKIRMEVYWHDYASASKGVPITEAGLGEKASVIGPRRLMPTGWAPAHGVSAP